MFKIAITLILINQLFPVKGLISNKNVNLKSKNSSETNSLIQKFVSTYIDFSDILRENEAKINETIDIKLDQVMNKLNKLGKLIGV
jgi:hypothetical protein